MATTSFGKITIIDVTDVGNFSVYPYANGPNTQIYSEENQTYYPDWSANGSHLVLTPVVTYAGQDKTTDATVNWYLKTDLEHPITTGFDPTYNTLTITTNIPTANTYIVYVVKASYLTETGAYVEAEGEITFSLLTQPSSIKNVSISGSNVIKYASDSATPSPSSVTLTAKLTGGNNITGDGWKYWTGSAWSTNYISNSGSGAVSGLTVNGTQLTVAASYNNSAAYFNADTARFKYVAHATEDNTDIYEDVFTVFQLRDGASGSSLVTIDLTNDDQLVPLNDQHVAQWSAIGDLASTTVYVYRGGDNITTENPITVTLTNISGVELYNGNTLYTGSWSSGDALPTGYYKVKVTGFTTGATSGSVLFETTVYSYSKTNDTSVQSGTTYYSKSNAGIYSAVANPTGNPASQGWYVRGNGQPYSATFSLVGASAGADGQTPTIYALDFPSIPALINNRVNDQDDWTYSPANLTIKAYQIVTDGTGTSTRNAYSGRVWYTPNLNNGTPQTGSSEWGSLDLTNGTGTLPAASKLIADYSPYTFRLVGPSESNIAANIKDEECINIVADGYTGSTGASGEDAINLLINNENVTLNATVEGKTRAQTISVGYQGYVGTNEDSHFRLVTAAEHTADPTHVPDPYSSSKSGLVASVSDNTTNQIVTITLNSNVTVTKGETGTITLNFIYTESNLIISKIISWDAKLDAKDGNDAIVLTFSYGGDKTTYFKNETGQTKVTPELVQNGTNILDNTYTVVWKNLITNTTLSGADIDSDGITAIIDASDIAGVGSYSCTVSKSGKSYVQYVSFTDYSDPLQVELISTVGDKLTNGVGEGVVYPQTTRDGVVLDQVSTNSIVVWGASAAPANPAEGEFYYNTGSSNLSLYEYVVSGGTGSWVQRYNYDQIIVLNSSSSANPIVVKNLNTSTHKYSTDAAFSTLTYVWSFRDMSGDVINPNSLTDLKVSYIDATHSPTITTNQITGGQFMYVNKNVVNNKIVILCQVTKN